MGPTRRKGESDDVLDPTRPFGELDGMVDPTRRTGSWTAVLCCPGSVIRGLEYPFSKTYL
ncbi:hypothetical protein F2Q68_00010821 [Brassica cretica]|uniref:Uncharacterized protein n=1 Tax=Brassica cretica TaxID=69181 RepID=A0A8S9KZ34_BRACR|nr:hypothetical protein F2Q68_00010821 [Brassica cretica]